MSPLLSDAGAGFSSLQFCGKYVPAARTTDTFSLSTDENDSLRCSLLLVSFASVALKLGANEIGFALGEPSVDDFLALRSDTAPSSNADGFSGGEMQPFFSNLKLVKIA